MTVIALTHKLAHALKCADVAILSYQLACGTDQTPANKKLSAVIEDALVSYDAMAKEKGLI